MPGNPTSTAALRPQAPAPWNPLDDAPPKHHSAAKHEAIPAPSSLAPLGEPHAPSPGIPAAFAPQPNPAAAPSVAAPAPAAEPLVAYAPAAAPPTPAAPAVEHTAPAPAPEPVAHENPPVVAPAPAAPPVVHATAAPAAPPVAPPPVPRSAPAGTIAALLNPAPLPPKEPAFPSAGNGETAAAPAVRSMSEQIAASIAATRATKPAQGATKMAAITASGEIAGGANAPAARSDSAAPADEKKKRRGRRKHKKNEKKTAPAAAAPSRVAAPPRKATPLSEVRKKPDAETKKGAKGAFFFTVLVLAAAGVGGQYAVNEGLITPPWAEPAVTVDDCVQGAQTLGSLAVGEEIDVTRVSCDQPGAQLVVAQVDSEDQCPAGVDGVVNTNENLLCVASATEDADTADAEQ